MSAWELDSPINASRWQQGSVMFFYLLALAAIWVAYIPIWVAIGLSVLVLMLFVVQYRRHHSLTVTRLSTHQDEWFIYLPTGQRLKVTLSSVMLWRYLVILRCSSQALNMPFQLVLFPDSLNAGDYRKLQARLRLMDI
ncbi:MAG: hypothetical protein IT465_08050 [Moraxellaceae bacterium]|nr:hypothetical protein [Moraxellaceae bacterium]